MSEVDLRFNRPLNDQTRNYLNHFLDDEGIGLLRWRGDNEHVVLTFLVGHANRETALRLVMDQAAMLWPHEDPEGDRGGPIDAAHQPSFGWWPGSLTIDMAEPVACTRPVGQ